MAQWTAVDTTEWRVLGRAQRRVSRGYAEHRHVNHPRFNLLPLPEVMGYGYLKKRPTFFTHPVYPHDTFSQRDSYN